MNKTDIRKTLRSCDELYREYIQSRCFQPAYRLHFFVGLNDDRDVYNIGAPFYWKGETLIAGRVEARDSEASETIFFTEKNGIWTRKNEYPALPLQDPSVAKINDEIIVGGVETYDDPDHHGQLAYRMVFYKGKTLDRLVKFARGPERMKDIRLLQLTDKNILVFTRPQGKSGGRGKIAYTVISDINELDEENIEKAALLKNQFYEEEWGGSNELHLLGNGRIGVLSHIARFDESGSRHYYSSCFCFDLSSGEYSPMKIIAVRDDFKEGGAKRPDLKDVIFSGGLIRQKNGYAKLYCGVSDAEAHVIEIKDPFLEYETDQ